MKKYSLWNNLRWYIKYLRKDKPSLAWTASGLAIDKAAAALLGVFTPALLVGAITGHATLDQFAWLATLTGLGLALTSEIEYMTASQVPYCAVLSKWIFIKSNGILTTTRSAAANSKG
jgi:ATP-binding cassette subfamily B protein